MVICVKPPNMKFQLLKVSNTEDALIIGLLPKHDEKSFDNTT